ncbi:DUF3905 domain-containing protein [Paenibacillus sp. CECT 9249]|uniref:DUF3905 domain-containing protein n=1 Tax=unclassified Paenibacillus TaxID=185978 RepID=UPI001C0FEE35|nr:DUF3905 domain-containing protein [Paenibacillus sp. MSJ-34]CAH0118146.1 hypothetical protein PAE9249_00612 [Paenibacillus sp. CECT 9249]
MDQSPQDGRKKMSPAEAERSNAEVLDDDPKLDPFEIEFLPEFREGRGPEGPFVNEFGVVIGDHEYESPQSPLQQWSEETEPEVMSGDQWVHPFKDIGFRTSANRAIFEKGEDPRQGSFMHPPLQTSNLAGPPRRPREDSDPSGPERENG